MTEGNIGNTSFTAELKRVREAAGLSQEAMAARLGLAYTPGGRKVSTGRAAVSSWESGRRSPSPRHVQAYIDLGGNPAILAPPPALPAAGPGPATVAPARPGPEPTRRMPGLGGWRWPWLVLGSVIAATAAITATLTSGGPGGPVSTWTETTGTPAHTWADPVQLTGAGTPLGPRQSVQVLCVVKGYIVQDGDPWWYRLASSPWDGRYYATSDAFYNNGATSGSVDDGVVVDDQVPLCPGS
jgi:hypothetical protein